MKNNIYFHASYEAKLFYCDSDKEIENCTISTASGEVISPRLLGKETLENGIIRHTFDGRMSFFFSP